MPVRTVLSLFALALLVGASLVGPAPAHAGGPKVAIIVGPTEITDSNYYPRALEIAETATAAGATVDLRYCATPAEAKAAADGASIIVYLGHGTGFPNPYSATELPQFVNGWGLRDPAAAWDGSSCLDSDQILRYYGESYLSGATSGYGWTGGAITPAANFIMVYSNACYAPGAGEARPAPDESIAVTRVANYSTAMLALGGSYFATDLGSEHLVDLLLRNPNDNLGSIFERGNGFEAGALRRFTHPDAAASEVWVQRTNNQWLGDDYWFAFAGNPSRTPAGGFVEYVGGPPVGISFSDIASSQFRNDIVWLAEAGITGGCGGGRFCPNDVVTREQMASFLTRGLGLSQGAGANLFSDDDGSPHEADIDRLATAGITGGCAAGRFCPGEAVTRAQMASFLVRALGYADGAGANLFSDDDGSPHEADIDRLATAGITGGCGAGQYCPGGFVTRGQMAAFLHRALRG